MSFTKEEKQRLLQSIYEDSLLGLKIDLNLLEKLENDLMEDQEKFAIYSDYKYQEIESGIRIIRYIGLAENLTIPNIIDGKEVVEIGASAFQNIKIKTIVIPSNITSIGSNAFENCTNLKEITISSNVALIGQRVFYDWTAAQTINIEWEDVKPEGWNDYWNEGSNATIIETIKVK